MSKLTIVLEPAGDLVKASVHKNFTGNDNVSTLSRYLLGLLAKDDGVIVAHGEELCFVPPPPPAPKKEIKKPAPLPQEDTAPIPSEPRPSPKTVLVKKKTVIKKKFTKKNSSKR